MPLSGGGFEQCYNAQALVDTDSLLVLATRITQAPNDKEPLQPMLAAVRALPDGLNSPDCLLADNGFCSEANIVACQAAGIQPLIALQRDTHHPHWREPGAARRPRRGRACRRPAARTSSAFRTPRSASRAPSNQGPRRSAAWRRRRKRARTSVAPAAIPPSAPSPPPADARGPARRALGRGHRAAPR